MSAFKNPPSLDRLVSALRVLPGVGPKSASRMAYHLLQRDKAGAERLARALDHALTELGQCACCNTFSETPLCALCADSSRDPSTLCVVEMPADVVTLEHTEGYQGRYFVLMGRLSPLDGIGPRDLPLEKLVAQADNGAVREVILATNFTAEGEATAHVLSTLLKPYGLQISRIARGMPVGGELEHTDLGTLVQALVERRQWEAGEC